MSVVVQVFNSGVVSGPETLVLPALALFSEPQTVVFLVEKRRGEKGLAPAAYARSLGLRVETVEVKSRLDFRAVRELRRTLLRLGPRVVHAHDVKATTYTWLAGHREPWRLVSTHHGVEGRPDLKTRAYEYFYSQVVLPRMHAVCTVSPRDREILVRRGLRKNCLHYVANGVTRPRPAAGERARVRAAWRAEIGEFSDGTLLLGMVARLSREKRHGYFLETLAELRRLAPDLDWRFLVIGAGELADSLRAETRHLGLTDRCHWLGYRDQASSLLPGLDLLAISSWAEGLPIVALEAGWAGVPVFASAVGALPSLLEHAGVTFPREQEPRHTAESLLAFLRKPAERARCAKALESRVASEYSAEAWAARTAAIYRAL